MNLDKKTIFKLLMIIFASILFFVMLTHLDVLFSILGTFLAILTPFIFGFCVAFILNIPLRFLETRCFAGINRTCTKLWPKIKRPICLFLSVLIIFTAIALLLVLIIPRFTDALISFFSELPTYMHTLNSKVNDLLSNFPALASWKNSIVVDWDFISNEVMKWLQSEGGSAFDGTVDILLTTFKSLFNFILGFVFALYVLASKESLGRQFRSILYSLLKRKHVKKFISFCSLTSTSFYNFVLGQCTEAVILGLLCFVGMLIFRIPYAVIVSCLIAVTALVPVFGALIGTVIGAFIILLVSPIKALWFVIFIIILQQLETHLIYPKVVGKSVGLPGIWVLVSVTLGAELMGAFGMLISVPICAVLYTLVNQWVAKRLHQKEIHHSVLHEGVETPQKNKKKKEDTNNADKESTPADSKKE